ncbi:hypothetical protein [Pandoraea sp.]|uniref:hypothetical protein n=1 Tax=Pandoraea sp. TaxID=1883445 RepID=UPI001202F1AA|nr:hypothetical protein [Pandoraea sp.]TAL55296.1 MAG: hypothetical protein EPN80_08090 [Pandoraea sp.]TAM18214.1 MAG: hypothetical protein EPN65_07960 [Pandoraea sp.]
MIQSKNTLSLQAKGELKIKSRVLRFRAEWLLKIQKIAAREMLFETASGTVRRVYLVKKKYSEIIDAFALKRQHVDAKVVRFFEQSGTRRPPGLWMPALVREAIGVRVVSSPAISQHKVPIRRLREFGITDSVDDLKKVNYVERRSSGKRYRLQVRAKDSETRVERTSEIALTEWAVLEIAARLNNPGNQLREIDRVSRPGGEDCEFWAKKHRKTLIAIDQNGTRLYARRDAGHDQGDEDDDTPLKDSDFDF